MLKIISFTFFFVCLVAGPLVGYGLSLLLFRALRRRSLAWPALTMAILAPFAALPTLMFAYLTGGVGEELAGTAWGVPLGIFVGSALMTFAAGFLSGLVGLLLAISHGNNSEGPALLDAAGAPGEK
jgi:hypothetical protein